MSGHKLNNKRKRKFAKIYDKYINSIYRFIFLKVGTQEAAQDLTGQVFVKGWKRFRTGPDIKNPSAYLYQIARTEIADHYRKNSKYRIISADAVQVIDPGPGIEENQEVQSEIEALRIGLAKIEQGYQNVLIWRYIDGLSIKKIAAMIEKSEGAVRVMIHRALKELKEKMVNEL